MVNVLAQFHSRYQDDDQARFVGPSGYGYVITENGIADGSDLLRPAYIIEHLAALHHARSVLGVPVRGYIHWTVTDNWEWADGYCPKFGLVAVDRDSPSLKRHPRGSYDLYRTIVRSRRVTASQRAAAWRTITDQSSTNGTHDVCRIGMSTLDRPLQMRILGGTPDPYGVVIDWRFNATRVTLESAGARRASTLLAAAMAFSKTTGIDPVAHGLARMATLSTARESLPRHLPPRRPCPTTVSNRLWRVLVPADTSASPLPAPLDNGR